MEVKINHKTFFNLILDQIEFIDSSLPYEHYSDPNYEHVIGEEYDDKSSIDIYSTNGKLYILYTEVLFGKQKYCCLSDIPFIDNLLNLFLLAVKEKVHASK